MSRKIPTGITKEFLVSIPLPNHGGRYAPIGHNEIMNNVANEINIRGFVAETELYRANSHGTVANGSIMLNSSKDSELKMMFFWGNSYDKSMRFMCGIGAYINSTGNYMFAGDVANYARKHTGNAKEEALGMIQSQMSMADYYYSILSSNKEDMKRIDLTIREMSQHVGVLFLEKQILNKEQVSMIRDMIIKEESVIDGYAYNNAWNFYNVVAKAVKESHPKNWFYTQAEMHSYFVSNIVVNTSFNTPAPVVGPEDEDEQQETPINDPNQLTLFEHEAVEENVVENFDNVVASDDFFPTFDTGDDGQSFVLPDL